MRVGSELVETAPNRDPAAAGSAPRRTVLLVAYHFPPLRGSSGMQRTLRFARHLPKFGWRPIVLSIDPGAYEETGETSGNEVPPELEVHRAFGFNAARKLSLFGRYPEWVALPDRWANWRFWAVRKALRLIRSERIDAIWTTFPIATAHTIGRDVALRARIPWIAEFRDPMWQSDWPPEPAANVAWKKLEKEIFTTANWVVFTAPSAVGMYTERFPEFGASKIAVIENGYDEETFRRAEAALRSRGEAAGSSSPAPGAAASGAVRRAGPITLLHSGIVYRSERDPTQMFAAVAALKRKGLIGVDSLRIVLRASGAEGNYQGDLERHDIADIVRLEPAIDYVAALNEMLTVDGLLLLQAANCNAQIPAKLYEYLRARRPILALTDPTGDTARTLDAAGAGLIARLDSAADIEAALPRFLEQVRTGTARMPTDSTVARYSREAQSGELATLLEKAVSGVATR
jgi:glycosyltransferase involved in cell wall biosynthesis